MHSLIHHVLRHLWIGRTHDTIQQEQRRRAEEVLVTTHPRLKQTLYVLKFLRKGNCMGWVVGRGSWVVGRGSWVVGRGSWVVCGVWCLVCASLVPVSNSRFQPPNILLFAPAGVVFHVRACG